MENLNKNESGQIEIRDIMDGKMGSKIKENPQDGIL